MYHFRTDPIGTFAQIFSGRQLRIVDEVCVIRERNRFAADSPATLQGAAGPHNKLRQSGYCGILGALGLRACTT